MSDIIILEIDEERVPFLPKGLHQFKGLARDKANRRFWFRFTASDELIADKNSFDEAIASNAKEMYRKLNEI